VYATRNKDYQKSINNLEFLEGAIYLFPPKIITFRLGTGGEIWLSKNEG